MNKPPAFQWYPRDWFASPKRKMMVPRARLAYLELLFYCWDGMAQLPSDPKKLMALAELSDAEWTEFGDQILENFVAAGEGFITNERIRKQWRETKSFKYKLSQTASERGKRGAAARWGIAPESSESHPENGSDIASATAPASASAPIKPIDVMDGSNPAASGSGLSPEAQKLVLEADRKTAELQEKLKQTNTESQKQFSPEVVTLSDYLRSKLLLKKYESTWFAFAEQLLSESSPDEMRSIIDFTVADSFWTGKVRDMKTFHQWMTDSRQSLMKSYLAGRRKKEAAAKQAEEPQTTSQPASLLKPKSVESKWAGKGEKYIPSYEREKEAQHETSK
jgi:uncharacterized protein YdaU (DUF1376 family)